MGKVHFNVKDIFGNNHKEAEIIKVMKIQRQFET